MKPCNIRAPMFATMIAVTCMFIFNSSYAKAVGSSSNPAKAMKPEMEGGVKKSHSDQLQQERIAKERAEAESNFKPIAEALGVWEQTRMAVKYLDEKDTTKASAELEKALGKIDILLSEHPNMDLIPMSTDVRILDFVADEANVKKMAKQIKTEVNKNEFQLARESLRDFSSEINISMTNLPMAVYPLAIRNAAKLISEDKAAEAKAELIAALNSVVITEQTIPLPVIKAQALLEEVQRQSSEEKINKKEANVLLNDAQEQLRIAQEMGYVQHKEDYASLQASIKQLKNNVNHDKEEKGVLTKIMDDLKGLKRKL